MEESGFADLEWEIGKSFLQKTVIDRMFPMK
ncbi:hypothetical protein IMSAGC007_02497 [Lachnospiraceae bacterium]|nr:hypothetical protein IMSAGC007_02497 [Lachnospiraceae bacterium]